jgi:hypothetical protein
LHRDPGEVGLPGPGKRHALIIAVGVARPRHLDRLARRSRFGDAQRAALAERRRGRHHLHHMAGERPAPFVQHIAHLVEPGVLRHGQIGLAGIAHPDTLGQRAFFGAHRHDRDEVAPARRRARPGHAHLRFGPHRIGARQFDVGLDDLDGRVASVTRPSSST